MRRVVCSVAMAGALVLGAGASGCSCTIGNVPAGGFEPLLDHPSHLRLEIGNDKGSAGSEGGGDVYVQYDGASKSLAIYMVNDYTVPALGPSCDFSGARSTTKGGYSLLHVSGVAPGTTGKFPVADAALLDRSPDHFGEMDTSNSLGHTTIEITKYDTTAFEANVTSPADGSSRAEGKLVATKVCPDLVGGADADAGAADAATTDTTSDSTDAGAPDKKKKKKKLAK